MATGPRRYRVELKPEIEGQLAKIPTRRRQRVADAINELADDPRPHGCKKLQGLGNVYRVRVGDYRIVYQVQDAVLLVLVVRVGNRGDVYRGL